MHPKYTHSEYKTLLDLSITLGLLATIFCFTSLVLTLELVYQKYYKKNNYAHQIAELERKYNDAEQKLRQKELDIVKLKRLLAMSSIR